MIILNETVYRNGIECDVVVGHYRTNERCALQLVHDNELYATATVNLPDEPMGKFHVPIKDYSENEGMVDALQEAGIIREDIANIVASGFVTISIYPLSDSVKEQIENAPEEEY